MEKSKDVENVNAIVGRWGSILMLSCMFGSGAGCKPQDAREPAKETDQVAIAQRWLERELTVSSLYKDQQLAELKWFIDADKPFQGMTINVVSETIDTHKYESKNLAMAFS